MATGILNAPSEIKDLKCIFWLGKRDGNYDVWDRTIFKLKTITLKNKKNTKPTVKEYKIAHGLLGFSRKVGQDLMAAAIIAGVTFNKK